MPSTIHLSPSTSKAHYILIGGFLGAGKTTAVEKLAQWLAGRGQRVGLITNDQGRNLVDTAMLRAQGYTTEEIPGGCFCCRFDALVDATQALAASTRPEVFVAEPVGSCTDLVATVTHPLRRWHGNQLTLGPVSVLVDPVRAERIFGLAAGGNFSEQVLYIYHKQIEEADLVVINKCDLLDQARLNRLRQAISAKNPQKEILAVSARNGTNLAPWFQRLVPVEPAARPTMDVDYQVYADGEARLGWLNGTGQLAADQPFDSAIWLKSLAGEIQHRLQTRKTEIAHLKMTVRRDSGGAGEIAVMNLVRHDGVPELSVGLSARLTRGRFIINLRAEADPGVLGAIVGEGLAAATKAIPGLTATMDHLEHFRPGKPTPTHRIPLLPV